MSTRAVICIKEKGEKLVEIYNHYDGYPQNGLGEDIETFLKGKYIVNGFKLNDDWNQINGLGDLAVRLIAYLKRKYPKTIGGLYIGRFRAKNMDEYFTEVNAEYLYIISIKDSDIVLDCYGIDEGLIYKKKYGRK